MGLVKNSTMVEKSLASSPPDLLSIAWRGGEKPET
jgi:hypothetical protein